MNRQVRAVKARLLLATRLQDVSTVSDMAGGCSFVLAAHLLAASDGDVMAVRSRLLLDAALMRAICWHARTAPNGHSDTHRTYDIIVKHWSALDATP